jgi:hypothetical protein
MSSPPVTLLTTNLSTMGCFKVSIVGALTSTQFIATIEKYLVCNVACIDILDFYKYNNPCCKHVEITTPLEGVFSYIFHVFHMLTLIISKSLLKHFPFFGQQFKHI